MESVKCVKTNLKCKNKRPTLHFHTYNFRQKQFSCLHSVSEFSSIPWLNQLLRFVRQIIDHLILRNHVVGIIKTIYMLLNCNQEIGASFESALIPNHWFSRLCWRMIHFTVFFINKTETIRWNLWSVIQVAKFVLI